MTTATAPFPRGGGRFRWLLAGLLALALLVLAFLAGYIPRMRSRARLAESTQHKETLPALAVTKAVAEGLTRELNLPGNLVAVKQTMVYARASGYVRHWYVDIGAHVREGDLLAELETPELTQQLEQARASLQQKQAALKQAEANNKYLQVTAHRQNALLRQKLISKQAADQANAQAAVGAANVTAAQADISAQEANVRQLEQLLAYSRVTAPFSGTITARYIDVGSLVNAGAAQGGALFQLQATDPLRVFIQVPQTYAPSIHVGVDAKVAVRQYTDRTFAGRVARTAGALDPATRTLNTEVDIPNPTGALFPGMYATVMLPVAVSHPVVRIPSSAIIYDASGVHVALVDERSRIHLTPVQLGRDNGIVVEVVEGMQGGERVVVSPPAGLANGTQIEATPFASSADGGTPTNRSDGG